MPLDEPLLICRGCCFAFRFPDLRSFFWNVPLRLFDVGVRDVVIVVFVVAVVVVVTNSDSDVSSPTVSTRRNCF